MVFDINTILEFISAFCLLIGSFLCISGGVGVLRFPDFYSRMHAVGVSDTLAAGMILIGLMLQNPESSVLIKLVFILLMTLFINPTASHALAKAAMQNGLQPVLDDNNVKQIKDNSQESESSNR